MSKNISDFDPLRFEKLPVEELIENYSKYNSAGLLEIIIEKNKKLVYKIAHQFKNPKHSINDLVQVAFTGLLVAINRFDAKQKNKFSTFAYYCIRGEIQHYIRDTNLVRIPRWLWKINAILNEFVVKFKSKNDRYPTKEEISVGINVSIDSIDEILRAREASFYESSFDDELPGDNSDIPDRSLIKSRAPSSFDLVMEDRILLWDAIDKLKGLNKKILILKYVLGFSQEEIGGKMGISQKSVSRNIQDSIDKLRENFG
ncbi:MAG: sigma-70 family RNA polymerase sigma factor [Actinomycetia bacterium]|nr:sigma-70 family RNA polymerase sigma factor [Actinomycetes bacterium]